jgi:hypothetical protein
MHCLHWFHCTTQLKCRGDSYEITSDVNLRKPLQLLGLLCPLSFAQRHRARQLKNSLDVIAARVTRPNMQSAIDYVACTALIADARKNTMFAFASN